MAIVDNTCYSFIGGMDDQNYPIRLVCKSDKFFTTNVGIVVLSVCYFSPLLKRADANLGGVGFLGSTVEVVLCNIY